MPVWKRFALVFLFSFTARAESVWKSGPEQVALIELYSSEGCSSCPPADAWLAGLRSSPGLWRKFVPVAFQVDYWNYLGWHDSLSRADFTSRQRAYASEIGSGVYTPEFIRNGVEQGSRMATAEAAGPDGGELEVRNEMGLYRVRFTPRAGDSGSWSVHGAFLGNGIAHAIESGENQGKTLRHEFVALSLAEATLQRDGKAFTTQFRLQSAERRPDSVAFWITRQGSLRPVQATGGPL